MRYVASQMCGGAVVGQSLERGGILCEARVVLLWHAQQGGRVDEARKEGD